MAETGIQYRTAILPALLLALAACTPLQRPDSGPEARVAQVLEQRGAGADALRIIDNVVRHEAPRPAPHPLVREALARPAASADAVAFFSRAVPAPIVRLAAAARAEAEPGPVLEIRALLDPFLAQLARARTDLLAARRIALEPGGMVQSLAAALPDLDRQQGVLDSIPASALEAAARRFTDALGELVEALRKAGGRLRFPPAGLRFESAIGPVLVGTAGDDAHPPGMALIVDPGGNDTYARTPLGHGAVSVVVDLGGDDIYRGGDLAVQGFAAIVDLAGNDRYESEGPAWGAAVAGVALLLDAAGDDVYAGGVFGQGAALAGIGALLDLCGNDRYRLRAGGQGFGMAGGVGLLWDRAGNDRYEAGGFGDPFSRGGGISFAQGAGTGARTALAGGLGILRDDGGDDVYAAQMFAQGAGYYLGGGLLWDRGGNDAYSAVRYAQGSGTHEAFGLLVDEQGNDRYELTVGVGQGIGLDLAVGVLSDGGGDDQYLAPALAQGAATDNGFGLLVDAGGTDAFHLEHERAGWGWAEGARDLPSIAVLLADGAARFTRAGAPVAANRARGGPNADLPPAAEPAPVDACPATPQDAIPSDLHFAEALRRTMPGFAGARGDGAAWAQVRSRLAQDVEGAFEDTPPEDFNAMWTLSIALRCTLAALDANAQSRLLAAFERVLTAQPASPFAAPIAVALRGRRAPEGIIARLAAHPACSLRTAALVLADDATGAQRALGSSCWWMQARALRLLKDAGLAPANPGALPAFLRPPQRP
ncbi:MAG TPA: hypothetical protein VIS77_11055 [Burkholderiales bacterium]